MLIFRLIKYVYDTNVVNIKKQDPQADLTGSHTGTVEANITNPSPKQEIRINKQGCNLLICCRVHQSDAYKQQTPLVGGVDTIPAVRALPVFGCVGQDSNLRSLAYEANEMTTSPPRSANIRNPLHFCKGSDAI